MLTNLTQNAIDKIQIQEGIVYINYGELDETKLGITRGGSEFSVTPEIRDIEYDGRKGKTKGMQVVDGIDALLKVTSLVSDQKTIAMALPDAIGTTADDVTSIRNGETGLIPAGKYLKNVTMFAKVLGSGYKKIAIYNAMHEGGFTLGAKPKAEGEISLEFNAHWNPLNMSDVIYSIDDVEDIEVVGG